MTPLRLWRGDVARWHSHPSRLLRQSGDTIHSHSARCAILLAWLNPTATADQFRSCILHDAAETITGDIPYSAKRRWAFPDVDDEVNADLGIDPICDPWIKLVDGLDAYLWMLENDPREQNKPDWTAHLIEIYDAAERLGVRSKVYEVLHEATHG